VRPTICLCSAAVTNIDTSGVIAFEEIEKALRKHDVQVFFVNPRLSLV
jgi:anti-anti-sigma regulatory factor